MTDTYQGHGSTQLTLLLRPDGTSVLGVSNYNWSTVERQSYELSYIVNGREFSGGQSIGYRDGLRKGFVTGMPAAFLDHFAAGSGLRIYNGETLVDDLSLDGTAAAVATLRRCVAVVRAELAAAERERQRLQHIPRDPFAAPAAPPDDDAPADDAEGPAPVRTAPPQPVRRPSPPAGAVPAPPVRRPSPPASTAPLPRPPAAVPVPAGREDDGAS